jgi:hypothetical protein
VFGVSAMAAQDALVQILLQEAPSTAVMTTNLTRFATEANAAFRTRLFGSLAKIGSIIFCLRRHRGRMFARKMKARACEFEGERFVFL